MGKGEEDQGARALRVIGHILLGGLVALVACMIVLVMASVGVAGGWLKEGLMPQLTVAACVVGTLVGGLTGVSRHRSKGILVGSAVGLCLFLLLVTIGSLFFEGMNVENGGGAILAGCLCGGALAGLLGGRRDPKRKATSTHRKSRRSK